MVLLVQKLARPLNFPSRAENHHPNSSALSSASLYNFRSKISSFISKTWLMKPNSESNFLSLTGFQNCFELMHITNRAFAKLAVEIDHPMNRWGPKLTDEYLNHTLNLLDLLNYINSSLSHLVQAKMLISHTLSLIKNSKAIGSKHLKKIPGNNLVRGFKFERPIRVEERSPGSENKENVVLQALVLCKKIGFLVLGLVLSGLCSDDKVYMEIRKSAGGFDDSVVKDLDLRFCKEVKEIQGIMEEVKELNRATERLSAGTCNEAVEELKMRLEVLENSIYVIEKEANNLFSEVLAARNKLLDNLRLTGQNS